MSIDATLRRMKEIRDGLRARAAAEGREIRQLLPLPAMTPEELAAQKASFALLRSRFKGPPLTSDEIIEAIERDRHPRDLDGLDAEERILS